MDVVKIAMIAIMGVLVALPLKKEKAEYQVLVGMVVCLLICFFLLTKIQVVLAFVERLETLTVIDSSYLETILKMVGIAYVAEFAMSICKDAGYKAIASQIEIFAKLSILVTSLPLLGAFLEMIGAIL